MFRFNKFQISNIEYRMKKLTQQNSTVTKKKQLLHFTFDIRYLSFNYIGSIK
ncbi:MAG: hypothetical protein PWP52_2325, partial [Bacteroidales bacterium]|nr:hypothetical protein [Bacteroidales bacterium]